MNNNYLPFTILIEGSFDNKDIIIHQTDKTIKHTLKIDNYIEQVWQEESIQHPERNYINKPKILVRRVWQKHNKLHIETGITEFKEKLASQTTEIGNKFGQAAMAITLGVTCVIKTADNVLVLGQRKTFHKKQSGGLHTIGGYVDPTDTVAGSLSLEKAIGREIAEELALKNNEWSLNECLGVIQSREAEVDVLFTIHTALSSQEISRRTPNQEIGIKFIPNNPNQVKNILLEFLLTASTTSIGILLLYGKKYFSNDWEKSIRHQINQKLKIYKKFNQNQHELARQKIAGLIEKL